MKKFKLSALILEDLKVVTNSTKCTTPNVQSGVCTFIKQCDSLYSLLMKIPLTNYDATFLRQSQCGESNGHPLV